MHGTLTPSAARAAGHPLGFPATYPPVSEMKIPARPAVDLSGQGRDGTELSAQMVEAIVGPFPMLQARAALPAIMADVVGRVRSEYALSMFLGSITEQMTDDEVAVLLPLLVVQPESGRNHPEPQVSQHYALKIADLHQRAARAFGNKAGAA